jgi:hypothetical protein
MNGYLGEKVVDEFKDRSQTEWAKFWIYRYAQIDGAHHKLWVLDQVQRILCGTKVVVSEASWDNGHKEYRYKLHEPSKEYLDWVEEYEDDGEYEWDTGINP